MFTLIIDQIFKIKINKAISNGTNLQDEKPQCRALVLSILIPHICFELLRIGY